MTENTLRQTLHRRYALQLATALGLAAALAMKRGEFSATVTAQDDVWTAPRT